MHCYQVAHETAIKNQELEDIKSHRSAERANQERGIEASQHAEKMRQQAVEHEAVIQQRQAEINLEEMSTKAKNEERVAFLNSLQKLGVDLTKFLIAEQTKIDKLVKVETGGSSTTLKIDTH